MANSIEESFHKACDHLPSLLKKLDSAVLLKFYALYKQATIGPCNIEKPSWYSIEAKSKYNAWNSLGSKTESEAMREYIELLDQVDPTWKEQAEREVDWSEEETGDDGQNQTKGWVTVSSMINEECNLQDEEKTIYEWAKEGNLDSFTKCLTSLKNFNINERDENGLTCLHWACDRGHVALVHHLVEVCGADINLIDDEGDTALEYAKAVDHSELIQFLVEKSSK